MTGWQRLKIVLSVIYWLAAGLFAWVGVVNSGSEGRPEWAFAGFILGAAAVFYAIAAAIWWAFAGFGRRQ